MQNKQKRGIECIRNRYSDQPEYYLNYLKKQRNASTKNLSVLGRHHNNLDNFIRHEINKLPKGSKIIDAGCGLSAWTTPELRKKFKISGVDGEPEAIDLCKIIYKGQNYRIGNLYNLTFKKNTFDAVVMREVIEHFKQPEKAVKEAYRILKPKGMFILTTPNYNNILLHIVENTYNRFFGGPCKPYKDDVHPSKFNPDSLKKLLSANFKVTKIKTIDYGVSITCIAVRI